MADATTTTAPEGATANSEEHAVRNENHLKQLIAERDAAKAKAKALEDASAEAERKSLEEQKRFKELYEAEKAKADKLPELEAFKAEIEKKRDEQIDELSKKLAGENQAEYQAYISQLSKEKQLDWLTKRIGSTVTSGSSVSSGRPAAGVTKAYADLSFEERLEVAKKDPELFKKISRA